MAEAHTANGITYTCQSRIAYLSWQMVGAVIGLLGGTGATVDRWYVVEVRLPYRGALAFTCKSRLDFEVRGDQLDRHSPRLQSTLLDSYMDLRPRADASDLRLRKALLPIVGSIAGVEITATPRDTLLMRARRTAGWTIPDDVVDALHRTMVREGERLNLELVAIAADVHAS